METNPFIADCRYVASVRRLEGNYGIGCHTLAELERKADEARQRDDVVEVVLLERVDEDGIFQDFFRQLETRPGPAKHVVDPLFPDGTPQRNRPSDLAEPAKSR